jgi:hypothetical protein
MLVQDNFNHVMEMAITLAIAQGRSINLQIYWAFQPLVINEAIM